MYFATKIRGPSERPATFSAVNNPNNSNFDREVISTHFGRKGLLYVRVCLGRKANKTRSVGVKFVICCAVRTLCETVKILSETLGIKKL